METLRTFGPRDVLGLLALWSRRWGSSFPLDLALWHQNTVGDPRHYRSDRCWIIEARETIVGALVLKTPAVPPAWPGQDPRRAWISVLPVEPGRDHELVPKLIDRAVAWLRAEGYTRVGYGGDPAHFFPGAPEDDAALGEALRAAGMQPGTISYDLLGDVRQGADYASVRHLVRPVDVPIGACRRDEVPAFLRFVDDEFPGRWAYETRQRLDSEPGPDDVLLARHAGDVVGFCHVYHRGSRRIGPSIYWREAIGERYGGLGPIGVHHAFRGRGIGQALLTVALDHLRRLGAERVVIDWTTLADYYARFGFRIWRTYRSWSLEL